MGPASYVVNAYDLKPAVAGNVLCKYADDTYKSYVLIPCDAVETRAIELENVEKWARANNLTLICANALRSFEHNGMTHESLHVVYRADTYS